MKDLVAALHNTVPAIVVVEVSLHQFDQVALFGQYVEDLLILLLVLERAHGSADSVVSL